MITLSNYVSDDAPSLECDTRFTEVFIARPTIQLQWEAVNTSVPECPDDVQYCVSYRCCNDTTRQPPRCTANTFIEFQLSDVGCEMENEGVFSVQVQGSERTNNVAVNFLDKTGVVHVKVYL